MNSLDFALVRYPYTKRHRYYGKWTKRRRVPPLRSNVKLRDLLDNCDSCQKDWLQRRVVSAGPVTLRPRGGLSMLARWH